MDFLKKSPQKHLGFFKKIPQKPLHADVKGVIPVVCLF